MHPMMTAVAVLFLFFPVRTKSMRLDVCGALYSIETPALPGIAVSLKMLFMYNMEFFHEFIPDLLVEWPDCILKRVSILSAMTFKLTSF